MNRPPRSTTKADSGSKPRLLRIARTVGASPWPAIRRSILPMPPQSRLMHSLRRPALPCAERGGVHWPLPARSAPRCAPRGRYRPRPGVLRSRCDPVSVRRWSRTRAPAAHRRGHRLGRGAARGSIVARPPIRGGLSGRRTRAFSLIDFAARASRAGEMRCALGGYRTAAGADKPLSGAPRRSQSARNWHRVLEPPDRYTGVEPDRQRRRGVGFGCEASRRRPVDSGFAALCATADIWRWCGGSECDRRRRPRLPLDPWRTEPRGSGLLSLGERGGVARGSGMILFYPALSVAVLRS